LDLTWAWVTAAADGARMTETGPAVTTRAASAPANRFRGDPER
jgi:hypothetical protein